MRHLLVSCLMVWSASVHGADLTRIERRLAKEPAYHAQPKYCLLAFGPEAKTRVWLVLDGQTLYMDRNGNGDLTEPGERFTGKQTNPPVVPEWNESDFPYSGFHEFALPDIEGQVAYRHIEVTHTLLKTEFGPLWDGNDSLKARLARHLGLTRVVVRLQINGGVVQGAVADFAERPEKAPVIHFGGPLTLSLRAAMLVRGVEESGIRVGLGTKGLGWDAFALLDYDRVPKEVQPIAEVEFPPRQPKGEAVRLKLLLERNGGCFFSHTVQVPKAAGQGKAKIRLSFDAWKEGHVSPATFEIPILEKAGPREFMGPRSGPRRSRRR